MPAGPLLERSGGIDKKRRGSLNETGAVAYRRLATSLRREVMPMGKRTLGESPALPGVFYHHLFDDGLQYPKSVLAARKATPDG